jgi:hypothetical protein
MRLHVVGQCEPGCNSGGSVGKWKRWEGMVEPGEAEATDYLYARCSRAGTDIQKLRDMGEWEREGLRLRWRKHDECVTLRLRH